jgi:hypothetical protein
VDVPAFWASGLYVTPPLFMVDPAARIVIPVASRARPTLSIPFHLEERAFTVDAMPRLRNGEARDVCIMAWRGGHRGPRAALRVSGQLVGDRAEYAVASTAELTNDVDGFTRHVLNVVPRSVPGGDYELRVTVEDGDGKTIVTSRRVHVE